MGKDFYDAFASSREVYAKASQAGGMDVEAICFGEDARLHITEYTQLAMLATEAAILEAVRELGIAPAAAAGLSLGEYGALLASGAIGQEDAFMVIRHRGKLMQDAYPVGGAMSAVLGLSNAQVEEVVGGLAKQAWVANYNCPGQVVITGTQEDVEEAGAALKAAGAKAVKPLKVSGPFHSPLLQQAAQQLGEVLAGVELSDMQIPYLTNVTGEYVTDVSQIKDLLVRQVQSSVRWQQCMERMLADGIDTFVEIGPGKTLAGFAKRINKDAVVHTVETVADLEKLKEAGLC